MDSALCLHRYGAALAVGFDYGQTHGIELDYAERVAGNYDVAFERRRVPGMPRVDDVVFAGRNAVLLSVAAAIAQARGLEAVMIGCNFSDAQRFPDCRPDFIRSMDKALHGAYGVRVSAPLLTMTKAQIVDEARAASLPETWTCYAPTIEGRPCGVCYSCKGLRT
jgi:7-cyano-7-deazaguanine synthase